MNCTPVGRSFKEENVIVYFKTSMLTCKTSGKPRTVLSNLIIMENLHYFKKFLGPGRSFWLGGGRNKNETKQDTSYTKPAGPSCILETNGKSQMQWCAAVVPALLCKTGKQREETAATLASQLQ